MYQNGTETKTVATSQTVIIPCTKVNDTTYKLNSFELNSIGSENDRNVFLTYKPTSGLPTRFGVKSIGEKNFTTSSLINLDQYEKSIRKRETENADVENYVYKSNSPGFYAISPWLETTQIKGFLITEYNGQSDMRIGPRLEGGGTFTCKVELGKNETTKDFTFDFGVKSESSGWSGMLGTQVTITGRINISDMENPTLTLSSGICYSMRELPDTRTGKDIVDITEYTVYSGNVNANKLEDASYVSFDIDTDGTTTTVSVTFTPLVKVIEKKFALNKGSSYTASNGLYIRNEGVGSWSAQYSIQMRDFGANNIGKLDYGYVSVPLDIDDEADKTYYEGLLEQINTERRASGLSDLSSIDDVPHRIMDEYEWSNMAHFKLSSTSGTPSLKSNGFDYPCSVEVLPAGEFSDEDGTIFNRVYAVQNDIYSTHINFNGSYPTGGNVWIDIASMSASIHSKPNNDDWKKLIYKLSAYDGSVPPRMRESVEKLKDRTIYLDDSYFTTILEQLKSFLSMIMDELNQTFTRSEIEELCDFDYSISNIKFKNYDSDDDNWNNPGDLGDGGLFGYDRTSEEESYGNCVENFNNHLLDEFKNDWGKIDVAI